MSMAPWRLRASDSVNPTVPISGWEAEVFADRYLILIGGAARHWNDVPFVYDTQTDRWLRITTGTGEVAALKPLAQSHEVKQVCRTVELTRAQLGPGDDRDAHFAQVRVAAGVIAVRVGVDDGGHRLVGDALDLVEQRLAPPRVLGVHHHHAAVEAAGDLAEVRVGAAVLLVERSEAGEVV